MNMYVDSFDDDELDIVLDESEGLEVLLNSDAITWSEINGDITKNKSVVDFLNNLPMLPDIPVEEVEHILKANAGEATWQIDNKATQEELLNGLSEVNQIIVDGLATKQDVGDYATKEELNTTSQTLQENIDTKQDAGDYATREELNTTSQTLQESINTKQDVGDYVTNTELENKNYLTSYTETDPIYLEDKPNLALKSELPDLTDYVKNTDYATEAKAGVIKNGTSYCFSVNANTGVPFASSKGLTGYTEGSGNMFIGKTTLENIKDDYVKRGVTENATELTADEKASAKAWLGYAEPIDIIQAIASIPQFSLSIVEALPETGAKMTLYLVPKEGINNDVYDEYVWIEQTSSYEHLGSTAVDLTDYVKNTDYATTNKGGVIKISSTHGFGMGGSGVLIGRNMTLEQYNSSLATTVVSKGALDNVLTQYAKTVLTTQSEYDALETKDANTLYLIEE